MRLTTSGKDAQYSFGKVRRRATGLDLQLCLSCIMTTTFKQVRLGGSRAREHDGTNAVAYITAESSGVPEMRCSLVIYS